MNNTLPIVVLPSRLRYGLLALIRVVLFAGFVYYFAVHYEAGAGWLIYAGAAALGFSTLSAVWHCVVAPPGVIIDEDGVGGRFVNGGFVGVKRIAWGDITGARILKASYPVKYLVLDVNNAGNKYLAENKWQSAIAGHNFNFNIHYKSGWWQFFIPLLVIPAVWRAARKGNKDFVFAFNIGDTKLSGEQAEEVAAIISDIAEGKPPAPPESGKPKESGKSPFAAD